MQHRNRFTKANLEEGNRLGFAFAWSCGQDGAAEKAEDGPELFEEEDLLLPIHPVFVIPFGAVERTRAWFEGKAGF